MGNCAALPVTHMHALVSKPDLLSFVFVLCAGTVGTAARKRTGVNSTSRSARPWLLQRLQRAD